MQMMDGNLAHVQRVIFIHAARARARTEHKSSSSSSTSLIHILKWRASTKKPSSRRYLVQNIGNRSNFYIPSQDPGLSLPLNE